MNFKKNHGFDRVNGKRLNEKVKVEKIFILKVVRKMKTRGEYKREG
jgi:hypothetical protein